MKTNVKPAGVEAIKNTLKYQFWSAILSGDSRAAEKASKRMRSAMALRVVK